MEHLPFIGESDVIAHTPYDELIPVIQDAFTAYSNGTVEMPDKSYVDIEKHNGDFRSMPAYINAADWEAAGVKWVNVHPDNDTLDTVMGTVIYTDPETGEPLATIDGTELTKRRTAAIAAIATDYLAPIAVHDIGVLGAGVQAHEQVRAIEHVRDFDRIRVSDIDEKAIAAFKDEFTEYDVVSCSPDEVTGADVLCTTTPVESPVITEIQNPGIHINAMGADAPQKQEFHSSVLTDTDVEIIVDSYSQVMHSGEISQLIDTGQLSRESITGTISDVVTCTTDNEILSNETTVFDSTGLAIQDIATAYLVYSSVDTGN